MAKRFVYLSLILLSGLAHANFIAWWNNTQASIPSGWSCISCDFEADIWYNTYPMCNLSNYGNTGGANNLFQTHTHTFNLIAMSGPNQISGFTQGVPNGFNVASATHTHSTLTINSNKANSSEPLNVGFLAIMFNGGIPAVIPSGALIYYNSTTAPSGFTRISGYDSRYPKAIDDILVPFGTTGGMNNHTHIGITSTISIGGSGVASGTGKTAATNSHTHVLETLNLSSADNTPPYYDVVLIQANSNQAIPNGTIGMFNGSIINANWTQELSCNDRLIRVNNAYGNTGGAANHSHNNITVASLAQSATVSKASGATNFAISHVHLSVNISVNNASNFPAFITVLMYRFQSNVTNPPDTTPPNIFIDQPKNGLLYCSSSIAFNHTETDGTGLSACWYNLNGGANTTVTCNLNTTIGSLSTGNYTLNLFANDTLNNVNTSNVNFSIDVTAPSTLIISPLNQTYNQSNTTVLLNLSTTADTNVILYSLNGSANITYTTPLDILAGNGTNFIEVFTNDSCNYQNYNNRYFTINLTANFTPTPTPQPGNNTKLFKEPWYKVIDDEDCRYSWPLSWLLCRTQN